MRSQFLRASLALAVLVLPALGGATPGPFTWKATQFKAITGKSEAVTDFSADADPIPLGFDFQFYGQTFNEVRIAQKGYITLGFKDPKGIEDIPADSPILPPAGSPPSLDSSGAPGNMIALWWGQHFCELPTFGVKYQTDGIAPKRRFTVEWFCTADAKKELSFTGQIRLFENSSVIQLIYGELGERERNTTADWTGVRAGIKNHDGSQFSNAFACPAAGCKRADFPALTVVQYGVWLDNPAWGAANNRSDVIVEIDSESITSGVDGDVAWVDFEGLLRNISEVGASQPVDHKIYLRSALGPVAGLQFELTRAGGASPLAGWPDEGSMIPVGFDAPSGGRYELTPVPSGQFYLCVDAQASESTPDSEEPTKGTNNWACDPTPLPFGPDLTGSLADVPAEMGVLEPFTMKVTIQNVGNRAAIVAGPEQPLTFTLEAYDEARNEAISLVASDARRVAAEDRGEIPDAFVGEITETIPPGESKTITVSVMYPFAPNNDQTQFRLRANIVPAWLVGLNQEQDADTTNNTFYASSNTKLLVPSYSVQMGPGKFDFEMPMGCVLGEKVRGRYEICNQGSADGFGFRPSVMLKVGEGVSETADENGIMADLLPSCLGIREPALRSDGSVIPNRREQIDDPSMCDEGEVCSIGSCWQTCDPEDSQPNNGCAKGFKCLWNPLVTLRHDNVDYTCMPFIEQGECVTYDYEGTLPTHEVYFNVDTAAPPHEEIPDYSPVMPYLMGNPTSSPSEHSSTFVDWDDEADYFICQYPRPDIEAVSMPTLSVDVMAGQLFQVERRFRNHGTFATDFEYGYYMSPLPNVSPRQWPVPVVGSTDGLGRTWIARKELKEDWTTTDGIEQRFDLLEIPPGTPPGEYYFGVVADPHEKIEELSKTNNTYVYPHKLVVHPPKLVIETKSLAVGTVGVRYNVTFWASGGIGKYSWEKGEGFPSWLELDPASGHLSGVPTEARDYVFTVKVRSGFSEARRQFALRILEPEGRLTIPKHVFPVAVHRQTYGPVELKANGGLPPYTWTTTALDGTGTGMPPGFCAVDGTIRSAQCSAPDVPIEVPIIDPGAYRFLAKVTDSRGATDTQELTIYVAGVSPLRITTQVLPPLTVGLRADSCISADGGNPENYEWSVTGLPRGLAATMNDQRQVCIQGVPAEFGAFPVNVTVSDHGMQASRMFTLEVSNRDILLTRSHLGEFTQGSSVDERLETNFPAQIRIIQGRLPSGLELTADNWVRGTISPNAEPGNYPVLLELRTDEGQVSPAGLGITVLRSSSGDETKSGDEDKGGCGSSATGSSSGTGLGLAAVMLGLLGSLRSRRRAAESN